MKTDIGKSPTTDDTPEGCVRLILLRAGDRIKVRYKNWRGETSIRNIELDGVAFWGKTQWHPEPTWLVAGTDIDKDEGRI